MTAKQTDFIARLAKEKATGTLTPEQQQYIAQIMAGHVDPTVAQASRIIDALLALPNRETRTANTSAAVRDIPAGRYAIEIDGVLKFFVVDKPTEGKWAGRTFVSAQASDEKYPVRNADTRDSIIAKISEDPTAAMIRYGHELGRCGNCGRTLTDEASREMGIGPECAKQLGIDRTPYTERARAAAVARVTETEAPQEDGASATTVAPSMDNFVDQQRDLQAVAVLDETGPVDLDSMPEASVDVDDQRERGEWHPPVAAPTSPEQATSYSLTRAVAAAKDPSKGLGWRERKAAVAEQQGDTARNEWHARAMKTGRIHEGELPGSTWEDIFGMGVGA